jgi:hypothetical protein
LALLSEMAGGSGAFAVGRAENRSCVVSTDGRDVIMLTMPPVPHRGNPALRTNEELDRDQEPE